MALLTAHLQLSIPGFLEIEHCAAVLLSGSGMGLLLGRLCPQLGHERCLSLICLPQLVQSAELGDLM